jgi:hypothetical protein
MAHGESLWPRLAGLPLVVESCEYERLHAVLRGEYAGEQTQHCACVLAVDEHSDLYTTQ